MSDEFWRWKEWAALAVDVGFALFIWAIGLAGIAASIHLLVSAWQSID